MVGKNHRKNRLSIVAPINKVDVERAKKEIKDGMYRS